MRNTISTKKKKVYVLIKEAEASKLKEINLTEVTDMKWCNFFLTVSPQINLYMGNIKK